MFKVRNEILQTVNNAHAGAKEVLKNQNVESAQDAINNVGEAIQTLENYHKSGFWGFVFRIIDFFKRTKTTLKADQIALRNLNPRASVTNPGELPEISLKYDTWQKIEAKVDELLSVEYEDSYQKRDAFREFFAELRYYNPQNRLHNQLIRKLVEVELAELVGFFSNPLYKTPDAMLEVLFNELNRTGGQEKSLIEILISLPLDDLSNFLPKWLDHNPTQEAFDAANGSDVLSRKIAAADTKPRAELAKRILDEMHNKGIQIILSHSAVETLRSYQL